MVNTLGVTGLQSRIVHLPGLLAVLCAEPAIVMQSEDPAKEFSMSFSHQSGLQLFQQSRVPCDCFSTFLAVWHDDTFTNPETRQHEMMGVLHDLIHYPGQFWAVRGSRGKSGAVRGSPG